MLGVVAVADAVHKRCCCFGIDGSEDFETIEAEERAVEEWVGTLTLVVYLAGAGGVLVSDEEADPEDTIQATSDSEIRATDESARSPSID